MPHTWASTAPIDDTRPQVAIVVWFGGDWARRVADCCSEFAPLRKLLRRGSPGLHFDGAATAMMRGRVDALLEAEPRIRLAAALDILAQLADADALPLTSPSAHAGKTNELASEAERLNRVLDLIDRRFQEPLRIEDLCAVANLSERSLHRHFIRHVGESVGRYLSRVRIGFASRQLTGSTWPVSVIAAKAGIPNLANFNRQFRAARGMTPSAYRQFFETHGHAPADASQPTLEVRPPSLEHVSAARVTRKR
jgi:AraC-like DNA-binding protein